MQSLRGCSRGSALRPRSVCGRWRALGRIVTPVNVRLALGKTAGRVFREFERIDSIARVHAYLRIARPPCLPAAVKVIHVVQVFVGLHARSALLISERALDLLTAEELRAVVAHEIGDEYFWDERQAAKRLRDSRRLQEVELRCDAIAVFTLLRLGNDPADLVSGVSKQAGFNELNEAAGNANCYVSTKERTRFVRALTARHRRPPVNRSLPRFLPATQSRRSRGLFQLDAEALKCGRAEHAFL